jgi:hypothetical protein
MRVPKSAASWSCEDSLWRGWQASQAALPPQACQPLGCWPLPNPGTPSGHSAQAGAPAACPAAQAVLAAALADPGSGSMPLPPAAAPPAQGFPAAPPAAAAAAHGSRSPLVARARAHAPWRASGLAITCTAHTFAPAAAAAAAAASTAGISRPSSGSRCRDTTRYSGTSPSAVDSVETEQCGTAVSPEAGPQAATREAPWKSPGGPAAHWRSRASSALASAARLALSTRTPAARCGVEATLIAAAAAVAAAAAAAAAAARLASCAAVAALLGLAPCAPPRDAALQQGGG